MLALSVTLYVNKLIEKLPDIFAKTELQRYREKESKLKFHKRIFIALSIELNLKFMSTLNKHQAQLDDSLYLHIRRGLDTIKPYNIFGEDDLMKGRRVRTTSAIAKTSCWVLEIK